MARRQKEKFPQDREEELLTLIQDYGDFADLDALADYFETTRTLLSAFLRTDRAKAAKAKYMPGSKEKMRPHLQQESDSAAETDAFKLETYFDLTDLGDSGFSIIEPYPEGLFLEVQEHRKNIRQKRLSDEDFSRDSDEYDMEQEE